MNSIDKQAQRMRNYLNTAVISGVKLLHLTTDELSGLLDELEKLQQSNASQDDHINQQADRIESLEKKNSELGKALGKSEKHISELETRGFSSAVSDVLAERRRQVTVKGWTPEHDDQYGKSQLLWASSCYVLNTIQPFNRIPMDWPWAPEWWKPTEKRRDLVKAAALLLAEIDRIDRAAGIGKGE